MWLPCALCLMYVAALCIAGTLLPGFEDNLIERIGMAVTFFGCAGRVNHLLADHLVYPETFLLCVGLAVFATGVLAKHCMPMPYRRASDRKELI